MRICRRALAMAVRMGQPYARPGARPRRNCAFQAHRPFRANMPKRLDCSARSRRRLATTPRRSGTPTNRCRSLASWAISEIAGTALNTLGLVAMVRGDYQTAINDLKAALELFEASNDLRAIWCLRHLGSVSHRLGEMEHAAEWAREGIRVAEDAGRESETAGLHHTLGLAEFGLGEYQRAENHWRKSLAIFQEHHDTWGIANALGVTWSRCIRAGRSRTCRGTPPRKRRTLPRGRRSRRIGVSPGRARLDSPRPGRPRPSRE